MARVTGIGGVFLRAHDPKALTEWYHQHLGLPVTAYGSSFLWKDEVPPGTGMTAWSAFPDTTDYFGKGSHQAVMINYRVDDLDGLLKNLDAAGVTIDPKRDDYSYGRFAWITDPEGNRVELWQPLPKSDAKAKFLNASPEGIAMFRTIVFAALACNMPLVAQTVPPSQMLDHAALHAKGEDLLKKARISPDGIAFEILLTRPDGNVQMAARVKSGQGEWHHDYADVLIGMEGSGEVVTGGKVTNGKETQPGEIRGDGITGGKKQPFGPGDIIRIEPQTAHQMVLAPGTTMRYMAVKIHTTK